MNQLKKVRLHGLISSQYEKILKLDQEEAKRWEAIDLAYRRRPYLNAIKEARRNCNQATYAVVIANIKRENGEGKEWMGKLDINDIVAKSKLVAAYDAYNQAFPNIPVYEMGSMKELEEMEKKEGEGEGEEEEEEE